jgi:integrase
MEQKKPKKAIADLPRGISVAKSRTGEHEYWRVRVGKKFAGRVELRRFHTLDQAREWIQQQVNNRSGTHALALTGAQLADAKSALDILGDRGTLTAAAKIYLRQLGPEQGSIKLSDAIKELLESKRRAGRDPGRYLSGLRAFFTGFEMAMKNSDIHAVPPKQVQRWLDDQDISLKTRANKLRDLNILFSFALRRGWILENPISHIERPDPEDGEIHILSLDQCSKLLTRAGSPQHEIMLPAVAIQLFAGLRRSEIQRLDWSEIDVEGRSIIVSARKAKTRQRRVITIRENLSGWLHPYVRTAGPVAPTVGFRERFDDLIEPFRPWPSNALRHSFGSYLFGLTKNENLVAAEMGNSPGIVFKHYRALVSNKAAKQFWELRPVKLDVIVRMPA